MSNETRVVNYRDRSKLILERCHMRQHLEDVCFRCVPTASLLACLGAMGGMNSLHRITRGVAIPSKLLTGDNG